MDHDYNSVSCNSHGTVWAELVYLDFQKRGGVNGTYMTYGRWTSIIAIFSRPKVSPLHISCFKKSWSFNTQYKNHYCSVPSSLSPQSSHHIRTYPACRTPTRKFRTSSAISIALPRAINHAPYATNHTQKAKPSIRTPTSLPLPGIAHSIQAVSTYSVISAQ